MDWNNTVLYPGQRKLIFPPGSNAASLSRHLHPLHQFPLPAEAKFAELIWTRIWPQSVVLQISLIVRWSAAEFHRFLLLEDFRLQPYAKERNNPKIHVLERVEELKKDTILYLQDVSKSINMSPRMDWPRQIKMILILHGLEPCCLPILQIDLQPKGSYSSGQSRGKMMEILTGYVYTHINCWMFKTDLQWQTDMRAWELERLNSCPISM